MTERPYRPLIPHLVKHVNWPFLALLYVLSTWALWGSPRWWVGVLVGLIFPPMVALRGHMMCKMRDDLAAHRGAKQP